MEWLSLVFGRYFPCGADFFPGTPPGDPACYPLYGPRPCRICQCPENQDHIEDGEHSVLFSTHITGDLERAADYITYISYGELFFTGSKDDFVDMFRIVKGGIEELSDDLKNKAAGIRTFPTGFEALMKTEDISGFPNLTVDPATIDEIVVFTSKKGDDYE